MKTIFALFALLLLASFSVHAQDESDFPVLSKQVEIRQAHLKMLTAIQEISMKAVITHLDKVSNGTDTSQLNSLLDKFQEQVSKTESLTTHVALNNALKQMAQITGDFRVESRKVIAKYPGSGLGALRQIKDDLTAEKSNLEALRDDFWNSRKNNALAVFDIRIDRAQEILDKLKAGGYDTTASQAKLDEIKEKRADLESALDSKDDSKVKQVNSEAIALAKELGKLVKDLQVKLPADAILKHWVNVADRIVVRAGQIISELKSLDIDVSGLEELYPTAQSQLQEAKDALAAANNEATGTALRNLKTTLLEMVQEYRSIVNSGVLTPDLKEKVEATSVAISGSAQAMGTTA